jgi:tetratricopeptide (TPR) repeat protein
MYTRGKRFTLLVVVCTAVTCSASFALSDTAGPTTNVPRVSPALAAPLRAAQDALQAKPPKLEEAVAKLKEAEGDPKKTPYDEHVINALAGSAYARLNDYPDAEKAFEAQVGDGFTDTADLPRLLKAVAQINYQLKNYAQAAEFGNRALNESVDDDQLYTIVSEAHYLNGQHDAVRELLGKRIESLESQGRDVPQQYFQLIVSSCVKLQDSACVTAYSKRLNRPRPPILIDPKLKHDVMFQASTVSQ